MANPKEQAKPNIQAQAQAQPKQTPLQISKEQEH
jgi:hypothetical protein